MAELKVLSGGHKGESLKLKSSGEQVLGSSSTVNLRVKDDGVARKHLKVHYSGDAWKLTPLADTLVNGAKVGGEVAIKGGDKIKIAGVELEFASDQSAAMGSAGELSMSDLAGL